MISALNVTEKRKKYKFKGNCNICHKFGHKAENCFKRKAKEDQNGKDYKINNNDNESKVNCVDYQALLANHDNDGDENWLVDSGATNHMCFVRDYFEDFEPIEGKSVTIANDKKVIGEGNFIIKDTVKNKNLKLTGVLFVPELRQNLVSVAKVISKNRKSYPESSTQSIDKLDIIHFDVCGPMKFESLGNYYFVFLDDHNHYSFIYFMRERKEVPEILIRFVNFVENQTNMKVKIIRSDGALENTSNKDTEFLSSKGIKHEISCPYTPEQNTKAERLNRTIQEIVRCLLYESKLDQKFWAEAANAANYVLYLRPCSCIDHNYKYDYWKKIRL
ncbi:uncharacterized protein LOC128385842 [Panonychus citri]|uniref:uncharacterized protein LOC128385842 n=1 Tax=Panonychus citri TaxID=50023 RepID=UPI0023082ED6|nr:uncharacterized protein LOC128385842 [Panonychus citri]